MFQFDAHDRIFRPFSATEVGRIGEGLVAKNLHDRGFYVFIQYIYQNPCDLIIMKGVQTLRVEVKTGTIFPSGNWNRKLSDVIAQVSLETQQIRYSPQPESLILQFDDEILRCDKCGKDITLDTKVGKTWLPGRILEKLCNPCWRSKYPSDVNTSRGIPDA